VVEYRNNKELITTNAVDQREGKPAEQDTPAIAGDDPKCLRVSHSRSDGGLYSTRKF